MNDDEQDQFVKLVSAYAHNFRLQAELDQMDNNVGVGWKVQNRTGDLKRTTWTHGPMNDLIPIVNYVDDDDDWTARYGRKPPHNPLYGPEQVTGIMGDKHTTEWMTDYYQTPTMEKDGALVYHNRMINLMRSPENGTLKQLMESKATKLCLYGTRFNSARDFQEFMVMIPMTVTELVIHHAGVFEDLEVKALIKVLKRKQLKGVDLKIRLLDAALIEAIRDNPSITSLVLHQPYRDDKKVLEVIRSLLSRKALVKWNRFEYYPFYPMDGPTISEYTRVIKYAPDLTCLGLNLDRVGFLRRDGDFDSFFHALTKSKLERLTVESKSGHWAEEALIAISQMKLLKHLTVSDRYWINPFMVKVLMDCPRLERVYIERGDHHDITNRVKVWRKAFRWPLKFVGYSQPPDGPLEETCLQEAAEALNRVNTLKSHRLVQMIANIDKLPLNMDIVRHISGFIPYE
jgi:hypothetical protein